jgi:hypothetical protein
LKEGGRKGGKKEGKEDRRKALVYFFVSEINHVYF